MTSFRHRIAAAGLATGLLFLTAYSSSAAWFSSDDANTGNGFIAGDEPVAVRVGQQILSQGGTAADAATALYFALSTTYPVAAGLGGGGICIVHDPVHDKNEVFDFLPRTPASGSVFALPGNVRGFAALQAAYGKFSWQRLIAPAEGLAAAGFEISRALSTRLTSSQNIVRLDAGLAAEFLDESGLVKPAGSLVANRDLATTLAAIRQYNANGFYAGDVAAKIAAYTTEQGAPIDGRELSAYQVDRDDVHALGLGDAVVSLPPLRLASGTFSASLISLLADAQGNPVSDPVHATSAAVTKALGDMGVTSLQQDLGSTGFVVMDGTGLVVTCAVTMNAPFGTARTVTGTGVSLAKAPLTKEDAAAMTFLTPMIITDKSGALVLAGSGAGGSNGVAALGFILLKLASNGAQMNAGDLHSTGIAPYDTINAVACQSGHCLALTDPGGFGLGTSTTSAAAR